MSHAHRTLLALAVLAALWAYGAVQVLAFGQTAIFVFLLAPLTAWVTMTDPDGWTCDTTALVVGWCVVGFATGYALGVLVPDPERFVLLEDVGVGLGLYLAFVARDKHHPSGWTWPLSLGGSPEDPHRFARLALAEVLDRFPHLTDPKLRSDAAETPRWAFASKGQHFFDGTPFPNPIGPWALVLERPRRRRIVAAKWDGLPFHLDATTDEQAEAQAIVDRRLAALGARGLAIDGITKRTGWNKLVVQPPALDATAHTRLAWLQALRDGRAL